ncbi:MAG: hypothetical protein A3G81_16760 [Betaproteobacteria bacterium RIFCSPLOWO2_12_FULL_65_14]|nr:MAG: hypothetical protein A3G81_16760 [Betaproteobacteria bacterium RIFCSPLOWO2_12_FULL_65_14]
MIRAVTDLAAFGASPALPSPIHVAQLNFPPLDRVEAKFRDIFRRQFYTNNGPLLREFEQRLAHSLGARHVVCVTNGTVALMMMAAALGRAREVIVPAFTFPATWQALLWAGLTPVLCDVDPDSQMLTADMVRPLVSERTLGILGVHLWGRACAPEELTALSRQHGLSLVYDACHAIGCTDNGRPIAQFGLASAFSLYATNIVSSAEGGCIATDDSALAAVFRDMRVFSSQGGSPALRTNGKMSEAQAALGLLSLEDLTDNIAANYERYRTYKEELEGIPGVRLLELREGNNYQYIAVDVDEQTVGLSRDAMMELLQAENVICRRHFFPGAHRLPPLRMGIERSGRTFPHTDRLCAGSLQLPTGENVSPDAVKKTCALIRGIVKLAPEIRRRRSKPA